MQSVLRSALREFVSKEHIRNVLDGAWTELYDEYGKALVGIRGRMGAAAVTEGGVEFGVDLIEMEPGAEFPLHTHPGDHILYVLQGPGLVHVDGTDHRVRDGDTIFIPAEYPHGVKTFHDGPVALRFLAVGHPHKHIAAPDRMKLVHKHS